MSYLLMIICTLLIIDNDVFCIYNVCMYVCIRVVFLYRHGHTMCKRERACARVRKEKCVQKRVKERRRIIKCVCPPLTVIMYNLKIHKIISLT